MWTKEPILRTFQVQLIALALLRLLQARLDQAWGSGSWWLKPVWNRRKREASILDLRRLFWLHQAEFSQFLHALRNGKKSLTLLPWDEMTVVRLLKILETTA